MRIESCRNCGLDMEPDLKCDFCKNFIRAHCPKCRRTNDLQIHIHQTEFLKNG